METTSSFSNPMLGGIVNFPDYSFTDTPQLVIKEQINIPGNSIPTTITLAGSVVTQVYGASVGGVNRNYPGTNQI